jgi:transcriptional regulator with XRE-family HTH domain
LTAPEFRAALKSLNLSQRSLAERLGVAVSTVNRWAQGKAPVPQYAVYALSLLAERRDIAARLGA